MRILVFIFSIIKLKFKILGTVFFKYRIIKLNEIFYILIVINN